MPQSSFKGRHRSVLKGGYSCLARAFLRLIDVAAAPVNNPRGT